jgi:hypothetical protein
MKSTNIKGMESLPAGTVLSALVFSWAEGNLMAFERYRARNIKRSPRK